MDSASGQHSSFVHHDHDRLHLVMEHHQTIDLTYWHAPWSLQYPIDQALEELA